MPAGAYTVRAFVLGTLLSLIISIVFPYALLAMNTAGMSSDYITAGAVFLFFIVVALANPLLKLLRRSWGLTRAELVIVYVMMIVASAIPSWGFTANLIPMLPSLFYYATPENNWTELLQPFVKTWLVPQDPEAIKYFFEGLPKGYGIPWRAWMTPLLAWGSFIATIHLMMIAAMVIIRRQWVDYDRLTFPLVQLPTDMAEEGRPGAVLNAFLKSPLMWFGFAIAFLALSTRGINHYFPFVQPLSFSSYLTLIPNVLSVHLFLSFTVIGLAYFLSLDVGLSIWLFHLLSVAQTGTESYLGYTLPGRSELFMEGSLSVAHQGMGAMLVLVVYGLWLSRRHLREVGRRVLGRGPAAADRGEILSYRAAVLILVLGFAYTAGWLCLSGVPLGVAVLFLLAAFAVFYGLARIVAEGGLGFARAQMTAQPFVINSLGTEMVGPAGIISLGLSFSWAGDMRTMVMASAINGMKLADSGGVRRRPLFWAMLLAIAVSLAGSIWVLIWMGYTYGGINLHWWFYNRLGQLVYDDAAYKIANPFGPLKDFNILGPRFLSTGIGALAMGLLMYARHRYLWWPAHYLGFPIGATFMISSTWFSILIGWALKAVILKYGGIRQYRKLRPLFLGLILGQLTCAGFWVVVDYITGESGNIIYTGMLI
jgi:hypothetical protein